MTTPPAFDRQLNAFLEEGPTDAPGSILQSVIAEVPSRRQRPGGGRLDWMAAPMSGFARGLAAVAAVAIVALAGIVLVPRLLPDGVAAPPPAATSSPTPSGTADATTPSPAAPSSSVPVTPEPTTPPSVAAVPQPCLGTDLAASLEDWQGAAGTRLGTVAVRDTGTADCTLSGTPGLQLIDGQGTVFLDSANLGEPASQVPAQPVLTLRAGSADTAYLLVGLANYCGADPVAPVRIAVVLPGSLGRTVVTAASGVTVEMAPCNGPAAPTTLHVQVSWSATAP